MNIYSEVLMKVRTGDEAAQLLSLIDVLSDSLYKMGEESFEQMTASLPRSGVVGAVVDGARGVGDIQTKQKWLSGLREAVKRMGELRMTVAVDVDGMFLDELKKKLGEEVVFRLEVDPRVMGGAAISYQGKYWDAALGKKVGEIWDKEKDQMKRMFGL